MKVKKRESLLPLINDRRDLAKDQKIFIEKKVKSLGSIETVEQFYRRDDLVTAYARSFAKKIFGGGKNG